MKEYKLIGCLKMFGNVPDFLWAIYENDGNYYFASGSLAELKLMEFDQITREDVKKRIIFLDDLKVNDFQLKNVTIGSEPYFIFQYEDNAIHIGNFVEMEKFFENYKTENEYLQNEINDFLNKI